MNALAQSARQGDAAERAAIAANAATPPELLTWLAADPAASVRAAVAANAATPPRAGLLLADDTEAAVRSALARRLGAAAPPPTAAPHAKPARMVAAALARLVEDAAVEVRAALADAVAGLPDAPRELVLRLARDTALPVAGPVLRLSPLLSETDLLALVAAPPAAFTRRVVATRPKLAEAVADAVADSADSPAIAALLGNPTAAIREATLDRLVAGAAEELAWHAALVRRPLLSPQISRQLGAMMAAHLLEVLAARADLPEGLAETLHARIATRLDAAAPSQALAEDAARHGDGQTLLDLLVAATGFSRLRVDAALALRSGRTVGALCWRAGWTAELAERVQSVLGVPKQRMVRANVEGGWTLSPPELHWQIELLEELPG